MKRVLGSLVSLVLVAACSAPKTNQNAVVPTANKAAETKTPTPVSQAEMEVREKATWEALQKNDYEAFANYLASDYIEIDASGVFDKPGIVANVKDLKVSDITFSNWKMLPIDIDAVVLLYDLTLKWTYKNQAQPPGPYRVASAWVNREGKWLAIYYQQTEIKPAPPPGSNQPAKAAASPAAKIGEAGPDPIANEKTVWDTFKSRNYDDFAALLFPEFVEVESDAIHDKAGSVKGVAMVDASKAELSEWKAVKFDNDAALVTYVVRFPRVPAERHSTIWVNRGGKWGALLHHGTPQQATVGSK